RVGDQLAVQDVLNAQILPAEDRIRVGLGVEALVHGDLGHGALIVAVPCGVALGDHGIAGVLAHVAIGQIELGLGRAVLGAVATEAHGPGHGRGIIVGTEGRHALGYHAEHGLA